MLAIESLGFIVLRCFRLYSKPALASLVCCQRINLGQTIMLGCEGQGPQLKRSWQLPLEKYCGECRINYAFPDCVIRLLEIDLRGS
jgi:hypothetical protein